MSSRSSGSRTLQALLERFPSEAGDARWQPLKQFLTVNPDVRRLNRAMGGRMLEFDPAASVTPRRVRSELSTLPMTLRFLQTLPSKRPWSLSS